MDTPRDRFSEPSDDVAEAYRKALNLIQTLRDIDPSMPTSFAAAFLAVALKPGQGVTVYAEQLGQITAVTSRILLEIGAKTRTGGAGLGLVDSQRNSKDLRYVNYYLTTKGEKLAAKVLGVITGQK